MTRLQIATMLSSITGLPVAYRAFPIGDAPQTPPYLIYFYEASDDVMADNQNYTNIENLVVELYTSPSREFTTEGTLDALFKTNHITYLKTEEYIEAISMYRTTYEMEVVING